MPGVGAQAGFLLYLGESVSSGVEEGKREVSQRV